MITQVQQRWFFEMVTVSIVLKEKERERGRESE